MKKLTRIRSSYQKRTKNVKRDEVRERHAWSAKLSSWQFREFVEPKVGSDIAFHALATGTIEHDVLPCFTRCWSKQDENRLREGLEIIVAAYRVAIFVIQSDFTENLRAGGNLLNF